MIDPTDSWLGFWYEAVPIYRQVIRAAQPADPTTDDPATVCTGTDAGDGLDGGDTGWGDPHVAAASPDTDGGEMEIAGYRWIAHAFRYASQSASWDEMIQGRLDEAQQRASERQREPRRESVAGAGGDDDLHGIDASDRGDHVAAQDGRHDVDANEDRADFHGTEGADGAAT